MDVEPADVLPVEGWAELCLQAPVALDGNDRHAPARSRMRASREHREAVRRGPLGRLVPQRAQLGLGLLRRLHDRSS